MFEPKQASLIQAAALTFGSTPLTYSANAEISFLQIGNCWEHLAFHQGHEESPDFLMMSPKSLNRYGSNIKH